MDGAVSYVSRSTQNIGDGIGSFADEIEGSLARRGHRTVCGGRVQITKRLILMTMGVVGALVVIIGVTLGVTLANDVATYENSNSETRFWTLGLKLETSVGKTIYDHNSTEYQTLMWLAKHDKKNLDPTETPIDELVQRFAVVNLYFSLASADNSGGKHSSNFLSKKRECAWNDGSNFGIFCDNIVGNDAGDHVVTKISMPSSTLSGTIPKSISLFQHLQMIDLSNNNIRGTVPDTIGTLTNMIELQLGQNSISGTVPSSMTMMKNMTICNMAENEFTGASHAMVFENVPSLKELNLANNQLFGKVGKLGNVPSLEYLWLSNNNLEALPDDFGPGSKLKEMHIQHNKILGQLPDEFFAGMSDLVLLDATDNILEGSVPSSLGSGATNLTTMKLSTNGFTGEIPQTFGQLSNIESIDLDDNFLDSLPTVIGSMTNLKRLDLSNNKMKGKVPTEIGKMSKIEELYLNNNELSGTVPAEMKNLFFLHTLDISSTNLFADMDEALCSPRPADFGVPFSSLKVDCLHDDVSCSCATECCDGTGYCCDMTANTACELTNNGRYRYQ
mmetsp:Transcript_35407/g.85687  ORF Transcript_35407/g.85687 Transcript_35407/m.85687 type:complete len:560 (+) Transcript_35407:73-1752(+)